MATVPTLTYKPGATGVHVDLDTLMVGGLLLQAGSGGGKSTAIRQALEETHGRVQHLVIDPEGEFPSLRERFDYIHAAPHGGDVVANPKTARVLCRRLVEIGASAVLDIYELPLEQKREFVKLFLTELMSLPRSLWKPILIVIDEADLFAPQNGEASSTGAIVDVKGRGRKRGFQLVLTTRRLSKLDKDAADIQNRMIGYTGLDLDIKRAGDELGMDKDARATLSKLEPGTFYVYGPAISRTPQLVRTGAITTTHPKAGKVGAIAPPAPAKIRKLVEQMADLPKEAEAEARSLAETQAQVKQLRSDLARAQKSSGTVDPSEIERRVVAAVHQARASWVRDMKRVVGKGLGTLGSAITAATAASGRVEQSLAAVAAAFLALDSDLSPNGEMAPVIPAAPRPSVAVARPQATAAQRSPAQPVDGVTAPQQRILDALAGFESMRIMQVNKSIAAVFADQSPTSSGYANNLGRLRSSGLIDYPAGGVLALTDAGRAAAAPLRIDSIDELHAAWEKQLPRPQWNIVAALIDAYPDAIDRESVARAAEQSPTSSGYANNLGRLRSLGLIEYKPGQMIYATELLFPDGLR